MKLFVVNISYDVSVNEQIDNITTMKYDATAKQFVEVGQTGNYIKNDLLCVLAETQQKLIEVIERNMGLYGEDIEMQILDEVDLDIITNGKMIFQGGFDINKAELQDLLHDATALLLEAEVL